MAITILKFDKSLSLIDSEAIETSESMTIDHYSDTIKSAEGEVEFTICATNCQIPEIDNVDYCVVIREKIDLTAQGPDDKTITDRDNGNYKNTYPYIPVGLPPGFIELKGKK